MINRAALLPKYKTPAIAWINETHPMPDGVGLSAEEVSPERTVYLISDTVADSPQKLERWIKANLDVLFEAELEAWYTDPDLWSKNRTYALFKKWFDL